MRANARIISLRAAAGAALLASLFAVHPAAARQEPLTTAFTYQGELAAAGLPATGTFDLQFRLFDAAGGGAQIGGTLCSNDLVVENGRFTVTLDFGPSFSGQRGFLEIQVRADSGQDCSVAFGFTPLSPRQELTATPNANFAQSAISAATAQTAMTAVTASNAFSLNGQTAGFYQNAANLTGTVADARLSSNIARLNANQTFTGIMSFSNPANTINGVFSGNGSGLTSLNGANLAAGSIARTALRPDVQGGLATLTGDWAVTPYSVAGSTTLAGRNYGLIAADGRLYTIATDTQQLMIWGLSNPFSPTLLGTAAIGGPSVGVAVRGSYAYVTNITTDRLMVFNISNPAAPALIGSVPTFAHPRQIVIAGSNAYVQSYDTSTYQIFDLGTPESPVARGSVTTGTSPSKPVIVGSFAYWTNFFDGTLTVADVSNVQAPAVVRIAPIELYAGPVAVSGQYLYVGMTLTPDIRVYDISNPQFPVSVGSVGAGSQVVDLQVSGGYLHALTASPKSVRVYSLSTPSSPTFVGSAALSADSSDPAGLAIIGSNAYAATTSFSVPTQNSIQVVSSGSKVSFSGPLASSVLSGVDGSGLTNLNVNATSIAAGTLSNARTTGTAPNTPNTLVLRDAAGNFAAGTITANLDGNASSATTAGNASLLNGQPASFYTNATNLTSGMLGTAQIPSLDASKITSGTLDAARIPSLDASTIASGILSDDRLSSNVARLNTQGASQFEGSIGIGMAPSNGSRLQVFGGYAPPVVEQSQLSGSNGTNFSPLLQSFTAAISGQLTGIRVHAQAPASGGPYQGTIEVYAGEFTGQLLASQQMTFQTGPSLQQCDFAAPPVISAGSVYTIKVTIPASVLISFSTANPYQGGRLQINAGYDMMFQTLVAANQTALSVSTSGVTALAFFGSGASLTNLNASNITTGILANALTTGTSLNTPNTLVLRDASGNFSAGSITAALNGTATNATQLNAQPASFYTNATNLSSGTLPDARLSASIPRLNVDNTFTSTRNTFSGRVGVNTPAGATELDVNGRINVASGVIQKDLSAGVVTATTDLGLYSQIAGGWIRFVTNNAQFAWFSDSGAGTNARMILSPTGNLTVSGSLAKAGGSFKIDHPLDPKNKILYHSFVESPDMMNIYNGEVTTDATGYAVITLPDYFEALNRDFRYQLTVIDEADQPDVFIWAKVVSRIGTDGSNRFSIRSSRGNTIVSWQVTGIRHDAWAEKNRIPNSVDKVGDEKGTYLHPEAFDQPVEKNASMTPAASGH